MYMPFLRTPARISCAFEKRGGGQIGGGLTEPVSAHASLSSYDTSQQLGVAQLMVDYII